MESKNKVNSTFIREETLYFLLRGGQKIISWELVKCPRVMGRGGEFNYSFYDP